MLKTLRLRDVGPAPLMEMELAPRINLLTGDNGLGKSFLLDTAWWALTRTWPAYPAFPHRGEGKSPTITFSFEGKSPSSEPVEYQSQYDWKTQAWRGRAGRPAIPGMVLYARIDGGFAVWDPARNYWRSKGEVDVQERPPAYIFQPKELWHGLRDGERVLCNGLIADWASWQREGGESLRLLQEVARAMSPSSDEPLELGALIRISLDDVRDYPTLNMPYGQSVPITHASAGMKRIMALAYALVWTWQEHLKACELLNQAPARELIFLIDEIEAHLHPRWQRTLLRSLLQVAETLTSKSDVPIQLLLATHSPLVLASAEPLFDSSRDALWELDFVDGKVELHRDQWFRRGDVNAWLTSSIFELPEPASEEREAAFERARALLVQADPSVEEAEAIDSDLRTVLGGDDPFWVRWSAFMERVRGTV